MTVLIKGFDMPKVCSECCLFHEGYCSASADEWGCGVDVFNAKAEWCPLVEVPTPHGKLVDLDAMVDKFWDGDYMEVHCRDLDDIPVIVEAETDKENRYVAPGESAEWISKVASMDGDYAGWMCSNCGKFYANSKACFYKYCPECGAKMRWK